MEKMRACGRPDCTECPKQRINRCHATPQQRDRHECTCGLRNSSQQNAPK